MQGRQARNQGGGERSAQAEDRGNGRDGAVYPLAGQQHQDAAHRCAAQQNPGQQLDLLFPGPGAEALGQEGAVSLHGPAEQNPGVLLFQGGHQAADQLLVLGPIGPLMGYPAGGNLVAVPDRNRQKTAAQIVQEEGQGRRAAHQGQGGALIRLGIQQGHHRLQQGRRAGQCRHGVIGRRFQKPQQAIPHGMAGNRQDPRQQQQVGPQKGRRGGVGCKAIHPGQISLIDEPGPEQGRRQNAAEGTPEVHGRHRLVQGPGCIFGGLGRFGLVRLLLGFGGGLGFLFGVVRAGRRMFGGCLGLSLFARPPAFGRVFRGGRFGSLQRGFRPLLLFVEFQTHGVVHGQSRGLLSPGSFILPYPEKVEPAHLLGDLLVLFRLGNHLLFPGAGGAFAAVQNLLEFFPLGVRLDGLFLGGRGRILRRGFRRCGRCGLGRRGILDRGRRRFGRGGHFHRSRRLGGPGRRDFHRRGLGGLTGGRPPGLCPGGGRGPGFFQLGGQLCRGQTGLLFGGLFGLGRRLFLPGLLRFGPDPFQLQGQFLQRGTCDRLCLGVCAVQHDFAGGVRRNGGLGPKEFFLFLLVGRRGASGLCPLAEKPGQQPMLAVGLAGGPGGIHHLFRHLRHTGGEKRVELLSLFLLEFLPGQFPVIGILWHPCPSHPEALCAPVISSFRRAVPGSRRE